MFKQAKKAVSLVLTVALAAMLAVGCGKAAPVTDAAGESAVSAGANGRTKVVMAVWSSGAADVFKKAQDAFNASQDEIQFEIQMQSGDYSDYLGAKVAANDLPDMYFLTPYKQVQSFADAGRLLDLSDCTFNDKIFNSAKGAVSYEGKTYAYPMNMEFLGVYYNQKLFEQAGIEKVPETATEFKAACEKLKAANITPIASTFKDSWTLKHLYSILQSNAVQSDMTGWVDTLDAGQGTFGIEGSNSVFDFADIIKENTSANMMDCDANAGFNALATGEAAMLISGEFALYNVVAVDATTPIGVFALPLTDDPAESKLGVDVGIAIGVNAAGKNLDATKKVLDYLSDNESKNGFISIISNEIGASIPAMPFDSAIDFPAYQDATRYIEAGNTIPWVYQQYINGFDVKSGDIFQAYMANAKDRATVISELDAAYKSFLG